jgi:hypothetical protein
MNQRLVTGLLFLMALGGCGPEHRIAASEFPRGCSVDSDCAAVYEGMLTCCGGGCPNAAINQTSLSAYEAAASSRTPTCSPAPPCASISLMNCPGTVRCVSGTCNFLQ